MIFNFVELSEAASTNRVAASGTFASGSVVYTLNQSAGRGCGGNRWESEPGKNIAMTMVLGDMGVEVVKQFAISMAVALGCYDYLSQYVQNVSVKWPNDIYVGEKKIAGILIEHSVSGMSLMRSLCGVGLNVNQEIFYSDAPNPVSLKQLTGNDYDIRTELRSLVECIAVRLEYVFDFQKLRAEFMKRLYRREGIYRWQDCGGEFEAKINCIDNYGCLQLGLENGEIRTYSYKEVRYVGAPNSF